MCAKFHRIVPSVVCHVMAHQRAPLRYSITFYLYVMFIQCQRNSLLWHTFYPYTYTPGTYTPQKMSFKVNFNKQQRILTVFTQSNSYIVLSIGIQRRIMELMIK